MSSRLPTWECSPSLAVGISNLYGWGLILGVELWLALAFRDSDCMPQKLRSAVGTRTVDLEGYGYTECRVLCASMCSLAKLAHSATHWREDGDVHT